MRRAVNFSRNGGRNKTFWFFQLGSFRLRTGQPFTTTVPMRKKELAIFLKYAKSGFTGGICNDRQTDANGKSVVINQVL